jgi:uncharacterized membrane protein
VTATTILPPDAAAYLDAVREALRDLPAAERDDLLAEVETSLLDTAAEGGPVATQLGPPQEFAAELRSAAGLHAPPEQAAAVTASRPLGETLAPALAAVRKLGADLAPIWWVSRGYVLVAALALTKASWAGRPAAIPRIGGSAEGGVAAIAAAIVVSVAIGLRTRHRTSGGSRSLAVAANAILAVAAIPVAVHLVRVPPPAPLAVITTPLPAGLFYDGRQVDNLYAYSRDGRLLHDVLIFDQFGMPLALRANSNDPLRRVLRSRTGRPIFNSFPIRYYEAGTARVARPNAAPYQRTPRALTPPPPKRR